MISIFDFNDAVQSLFEAKQALSRHPLSKIAGSRVGIDISQLVHHFVLEPDRLSYANNLRKYKDILWESKIEMEIAFPGINIANPDQLVPSLNIVHNLRENFYYFFMIYIFNLNSTSADKDQLLNSMSFRYLKLKDTFMLSVYYEILKKTILKAVVENGLEFFRAPQLVENQLLFNLKKKKISQIYSSPLCLLVDESQPVILEIDFGKRELCFYEIGKLAEAFKCEIAMLRKCLIGAFVYFMCSEIFQTETKFSRAAKEQIDDFEALMKKLINENIQQLQSQILLLLGKFHNSDIGAAFCDELSEIYKFPAASVLNSLSFLFNSVIMNEFQQYASYKFNPNFASQEFLLTGEFSEFAYLDYKMILSQNLSSLLRKCRDYCCYISYPNINSLEFEYAYMAYYKAKLEICLSKLAQYFPENCSPIFKFKMFELPAQILKIEPRKNFKRTPFVSSTSFSLYNTLFAFYEAVNKERTWINLHGAKNINAKQILFSAYIGLFDDLGYIVLQEEKILVLGAGFLEGGLSQFNEELLIIFELLRHNLLKPDIVINGVSILAKYREFFRENIFDNVLLTAEEILKFLRQISIEPPETSNYINILSDCAQNSDRHNSFQSPSEPNKNAPVPKISPLRASLTKTMNIYYIVLKTFTRKYSEFCTAHKLPNNQGKLLQIAFGGESLKTIQIISRIFVFSKTDFALENIFDMDSYYFEQIANVIIKGLVSLASANIIHVLHQTGKISDVPTIDTLSKHLLFRKNYSALAGNIVKMLLSTYLIFKSLKLTKDPFLNEYSRFLEVEYIRSHVPITFSIKEFLANGKALMESVFEMVKNTTKYYESILIVEFLESRKDAMHILNEVIAFYD